METFDVRPDYAAADRDKRHEDLPRLSGAGLGKPLVADFLS
jgi:hypothetical protein